MDQDAHGGISELSVGVKVFGVDVMNGMLDVLKSLSESLFSAHKYSFSCISKAKYIVLFYGISTYTYIRIVKFTI